MNTRPEREKTWLNMVAHICNPNSLEGRGSWFEANPGKMLAGSYLKGISLAWWYRTVIPATQEAEVRKIAVQGQPWAKAQVSI
jgi:hypothetical protein